MVTLCIIDDWLDGARSRVNAKQFEMIQLVADKLKVELCLLGPAESLRAEDVEPLRYLLHGPPGTGKSHAVKLLTELFEVAGYKKGLDYEFVAFQATNAADLAGKTIHDAIGLTCNPRSVDKAVSPEKAQQMANWRWVFIDEISLAPANLLAVLDQRLRQVKPRTDPWKFAASADSAGEARPFGGVNVIFIGDFKQLPPPQGGYLASVPHHLRVGPNDSSKPPDALVDAGQRLMWEDCQGMVELTERERCKDPWWNEVNDETRACRLSDKNHNYLHGIPVEGCQLSTEERASRRRVITGPEDPRLRLPRFQEAPVIVANNDAKYQINKDRAMKYAKDANAELLWSHATDVASSDALKADVCDRDRKIKLLGSTSAVCFCFGAFLVCFLCIILHQINPRWLTYHDKDTGNLPGMLPLAIGMRVALTEHLDRPKQLLRGTVGIVHSWEWLPNNLRPSVVYIKFEDATWQLEGTNEPGIYPAVPTTTDWYLDGGRKMKTLKVNRRQLPLIPAYAMTAHASEGKTLPAVLLDLQVDKRVDRTIGTVATTRVRSREDVLILRPFPKWLFQRGLTKQRPDLLLQKLRGEAIDWAAVREATRPCADCRECQQILPMGAYAFEQWELIRANKAGMCRRCKDGVVPKRRRKVEGDGLEKHECLGCNTLKIAEAFPRAQLPQEDANTLRRCLKCLQVQRAEMQCCHCFETKAQPEFAPEMVTMPPSGILCRACQEEARQRKTKQWSGCFCCRTCKKYFLLPAAAGKGQVQHCLNCASRESRKKGEQTCRNDNCKRKFTAPPSAEGKRQRYCQDCRRR